MRADRLLILNAGSSSLKFALYALADGADPSMVADGQVDGLPAAPRWRWNQGDGPASGYGQLPAMNSLAEAHGAALDWLLKSLPRHGHDLNQLRAAGHRVVHGGLAFDGPVRIDAGVLAQLEQLVPLAPLHQPHNLAAIRALQAAMPELPQVASFDTAFHRTQPELATRFALTAELHREGVRRYGFHGLSYAWIAQRLAQLDPRAAAGRAVVLHLGNGASLCALQACRSIATSMGFSALDGVPMGTRCGALDPGVLLYLLRQGWDASRIERLLYQQSGLLGVSGISSDVRTLLESSEPRAALALDLFVYRIVREIGALVAVLGGLDALVFTAGIGEHAAPIRARIVGSLGWLGPRLEASANATHAARITTADSPVAAWIIPTDEEAVIARETLAVLGA